MTMLVKIVDLLQIISKDPHKVISVGMVYLLKSKSFTELGSSKRS